MEYRKIGTTGLSASVVALGTEYLYDASLPTVVKTIHEAIDQGVNLLDMVVPTERTRTNIGKAIVGKRDKLIIQGHICATDLNERFDISRNLPTVKKYFEMLLRALGTDYIDFGMLFLIDTEEAYREVFDSNIIEYALDLKKKGVVRHLGVSSHNPEIALHMVQTNLIDLLMFPVNPAFDLMDAHKNPGAYHDLKKEFHSDTIISESKRTKLYQYCMRNGIAITAMKPFLGGRLLDGNLSPFGQSMTVGQCIHYSLTRAGVVSVVCGCANAEEVRSVCESLTLSAEEKDFTKLISKMKSSFEGNCVYCNHCEPCPSGIHIAEINKALDIALIDNRNIPDKVRDNYLLLKYHGSDCVRCGNCEKRCPFSVPIINNMALANKIYGK